MRADRTPHPRLPKAPPSRGPQPLWDRLLGRPWPRVDVLLLKTAHCPLCETAHGVVRSRERRLGIRLRIADISGDPELLEAYGEEVPVVFVAGMKRFIGRVDPALLGREVRAARRAEV